MLCTPALLSTGRARGLPGAAAKCDDIVDASAVEKPGGCSMIGERPAALSPLEPPGDLVGDVERFLGG